jgi:hypothetical protein
MTQSPQVPNAFTVLRVQTNSLQFNKIIKDAVLKLNIFIVLDKDKPDFVDNVCEHTVFVYVHTYITDVTYSYC